MGALKSDGPQLSDFLRRPKDYKQNKICFLLSESEHIANSSVWLSKGTSQMLSAANLYGQNFQ
jgi:hypothetical protein